MDWEFELRLIETPDKKIEQYKELEGIISEQGHSGFSMSYLMGLVRRFLSAPEEDFQEHLVKLESQHDECGMQRLMNNNVREILSKYKEYEWDPKDLENLLTLLNSEPLTPLLGTEDEWEEIPTLEDDDYLESSYQNKRCSAVFKDVYKNGLEICYYLDSKVYSDNGGINWFTTGRFGREEITFPFTPKTEYVYLFEPREDVYITLKNSDNIKKLKELKEKEYSSEE